MIIARVAFYGAIFAAIYGAAVYIPDFQANIIANGVKWFAMMMGLFSSAAYPLVNKANDLANMEGLPYRSALRLQARVVKINKVMQARWIISLIAAVSIGVLSFVLAHLDQQTTPRIILALIIQLTFTSIYFLLATIFQYFQLLTSERDLKNEIQQIGARKSFWMDKDQES